MTQIATGFKFQIVFRTPNTHPATVICKSMKQAYKQWHQAYRRDDTNYLTKIKPHFAQH